MSSKLYVLAQDAWQARSDVAVLEWQFEEFRKCRRWEEALCLNADVLKAKTAVLAAEEALGEEWVKVQVKEQEDALRWRIERLLGRSDWWQNV